MRGSEVGLPGAEKLEFPRESAVGGRPEMTRAGPDLAQSLTGAGLIDEYQIYLRPVVLGSGKPFFAGPRPPLHLVASDLIVEDLIRLTYVPA